MIKQLLNSVIAKYCDLSVSRNQLFASAELATDKSRYLAQPSPIIVNYGLHENGEYFLFFFLLILVGALNKVMNAAL